LDEPGALEPADRTTRDDAPRRPVGREHDDGRGRDGARAHARDTRVGPREIAVPTTRQLSGGPASRRADDQAAEARFVAAPRDLVSRGRPRERPLARRPRGLGALVLLRNAEHGLTLDDELAVADPRDPAPVGREPRLAVGAVLGEDVHRAALVASHEARRM